MTWYVYFQTGREKQTFLEHATNHYRYTIQRFQKIVLKVSDQEQTQYRDIMQLTRKSMILP